MAGTVRLLGINLIDGVNYSIERGEWAPSVAGMRRNQLGGYGPYSDVEETIPLIVRGATAGSVYLNLMKLQSAFEDAERSFIDAVSDISYAYTDAQLVYQPQGGTAATALVIGRADNAIDAALQLPPTYDDAGLIFQTEVALRFRRRGIWRHETVAGTTGGASGTQPLVLSSVFAGTTYARSPVTVRLLGLTGRIAPTIADGVFAAVACGAAQLGTALQIVEAETMTATGWTGTAAPVAQRARGGSILRYSATGTAASTSGTVAANAMYGRVVAIAAVRNNSTLTSFNLRAEFIGGATVVTPYTLVDTSSTVPRIVVFDPVSVPPNRESAGPFGGTNMKVRFTAAAAVASGTQTLDVDYFALVQAQNETTTIVRHGSAIVPDTGSVTMVVNNDPIYARPSMYQVTAAGVEAAIPASGDMTITMPAITDGVLGVAWFATNGTAWRFTQTNGSVPTISLASTLYRAKVVP